MYNLDYVVISASYGSIHGELKARGAQVREPAEGQRGQKLLEPSVDEKLAAVFDNPEPAARSTAEGVSINTSNQRRIVIGMLVSFALGLLKLVTGLVGHSYALVADAIESFTDIISGVVVWGGLHMSARAATEKHPYGYGKAEALAAAAVAGIVFVAAIGIGVEAVHEIITPHHAPAPYTIVVLLFVVVVKALLARSLGRAGAESESVSLTADAFHHRADVITSALACVGISIALIGGPGWEPADDWAALLASGVILFNAVKLMAIPVRELLDVHVDTMAAQARDIAMAVPNVANVEKVVTRKSGPFFWVDMHLWVDPEMNVRTAHSLSHQVKDEIQRQLPSVQDVLIHIEPDTRGNL